MSRLWAPTLRQAPAEAETPSHRLMLQAGLIRRAAAGTYTWLPLGLRVLHKVASIVREEMVAAGAQELLMPIVQPAELWQESGRWADYGDELFRLQDRHGRSYALGPTHEELITDLVRGELRSYRQLPLCLFQIQLKYRDEVRPRFGVMRSREFMMKDAYSFDRDEAGLDASYEAMRAAYQRAFDRMGLSARPAFADAGAIGGQDTHEFVVPSPWGEARLVSCAACGYLANVERADATARTGARAAATLAADDRDKRAAHTAGAQPPSARVRTPGLTTVAGVASFLRATPDQLIKTLIVTTPAGEAVAALVRGDHELSPAKLARALGVAGVTMATAETVIAATGAPLGFAGPVGLRGLRIVADAAVTQMDGAISGANEADHHLRGVVPGRDFRWDMAADLREVGDGDPCPACGARLAGWRGIELGHVFKLGTKYSRAFGASYAAEDGRMRPAVMGCYGIGISRCVAAVVEQSHDELGIVWPAAVAPYQALVLPINDQDPAQMDHAVAVYEGLRAAGVEALLDDRSERAGVKFRDADLIGIPWRVAVGPRALADGEVELQERATGKSWRVEAGGAAAAVAGRLGR
jgi:prolyl-tRNA synthetase